MAYFEGRFVMITSPIEARSLEYDLTLATQEARRNCDLYPPPWLVQLQTNFTTCVDPMRVWRHPR